MHILYTDSMVHLHLSHDLHIALTLILSHLYILILLDTIKRSPIYQLYSLAK
jgi:hypothetical protein